MRTDLDPTRPQTEFEQIMFRLRLINRQLDVKLTLALILSIANFGVLIIILARSS